MRAPTITASQFSWPRNSKLTKPFLRGCHRCVRRAQPIGRRNLPIAYRYALMASAPVLARRQLNRSLLARQMLLERVELPAIEVIERLVGMQAQVPTDPYTALWSRIEGFKPEELSELISERRAVRVVGLMRTTIHLVSARDALRIRPLMQPVLDRAWRYSPFSRSL